MRATWAIFRKESKGFFLNPNFVLVCGICASVLSFKYIESFVQFGRALAEMVMPNMGMDPRAVNIHYRVFWGHLSVTNLILIFAVPALCMRLLAEEKKMKTFDLLLTSPVTSAQIVIGKFAAVLAAILGLILMSLAYPVATRAFASFNWASLLVATLGVFLVAAVYAAMDLFCSALTESAIVSYILAVILNVLVWLLGSLPELADGATARQILEHLSLNTHMMALLEGTLRTSSLIFFMSFIALFVLLTERVVEASRWR